MSKEKDFKIGLYELFNSGGTNGGLFIDGDDAEMLHDEIILLFKKLNIADVSKRKPLPPEPPKDREVHISGKSRHKRD
jgi:hypothetical protein